MEYTVKGVTVGYGDDVLQMLDIAEAAEIGRHRQVEALLRGASDVDRQLVIDECVVVLDHADTPDPVLQVAVRVLKVLKVDPAGPIRRLDAGTPTLARLQQADRRRELVSETKKTAAGVASTAAEAASEGLSKAKRWLDRKRAT